MNILLSAAGFFPSTFGGGEIYVYRLSKELLKRGHRVKVLVRHGWNDRNERYTIKTDEYEGIPITAFSVNSRLADAAEKHTALGRSTSELLQRDLKQFSPDVVHINGLKAAMVNLCDELKIPHVVTAHHMGIACPAGALLRPDYSICDKPANRRDCVPCCCYQKAPKWYIGKLLGRIPPSIYRPIGKTLNHTKNLPYFGRGLIYPWLIEKTVQSEKILLTKGKHFIAPSEAIKELLIRNGCEPSKVTLLPHGIELLNKIPFESFSGRAVRFGYVGRIDPSKGLHILLEAMKSLPNGKLFELHIFGAARNPWDEEYRKRTMANYHANNKVINHGLIPTNRMQEAYRNIDVLVVPSILAEAFGLVVAEAFSAGRPVIVANSGALQEQVRDGIDGFVVERNNSKALAEAMQKFIDNPNLVLEMSNQIRPVKTIQQYVDEIEEIYHQLISSKN